MKYNNHTERAGCLALVFWLIVFLFTMQAGTAEGAEKSETISGCPSAELKVTALPPLHVPRIGHAVMCIGDEVVAFGGHTSGFVPTPTAEYYSNGEWHLMQMAYPHDQGAAALTGSGKVVIFGGHEKELGIGQTFTVELYDPVEHTFTGYGCLDKKRCFAKALPMKDGNIIVTGSWYAEDGIECFDGSRQNLFVKAVAQQRSIPYILRTSRNNAIFFSDRDIHADLHDTILIDRLHGEPFTAPLFEEWRPFYNHIGHDNSQCFAVDEKEGKYVNLLQVMQGDSIMAIARVDGEDISLLPTTCPLPMRSTLGRIMWFSYILANRSIGRAYIVGYGENSNDRRYYVACIDYNKIPSPVTLLYSEPQDTICIYQPVLTRNGDLLIAGGTKPGHVNNFEATRLAFLLHTGTEAEASHAAHTWLWACLLAFVLLASGIAAVLLLKRKKRQQHAGGDAADTVSGRDEELMQQLLRLMEEKKPYLNSNLRVEDVADLLGTNRTYVSNCIKNIRGCQFIQFVNAYRIEHAKQLLRQNRDIKTSYVWTASGFSSEASFFRNFKETTGMTPKEWLNAYQEPS